MDQEEYVDTIIERLNDSLRKTGIETFKVQGDLLFGDERERAVFAEELLRVNEDVENDIDGVPVKHPAFQPLKNLNSYATVILEEDFKED